MRRALALLAAGLLAATAAPAAATIGASSASATTTSSYNGLALTPPMGFNDWNVFGCNVTEAQLEGAALAMHTNGMQAAGYNYVNVDDCWINGRNVVGGAAAKIAAGRDANGHLIADPTYFPDGIAALAAYVHSLGMKFGIYEDIGTATCQGLAGSYGHEAEDAQDFANWGVDYLKYDDCNLPPQIPATPAGYQAAYQVMSNALEATGRPIVYSICEHTGVGTSWLWGATQSNLWRTTTDIRPNFASMLANFTNNSALGAYAGPGHWNDPDALEIGTGTITKLGSPAAAGDTNVKVASVSSAIVGGPITIGTTAAGNLESATVASIGTAATATTLFNSAAVGDTNVKVASVNGFVVGGPITVDIGSSQEAATVSAIGTSGARSTLFTAASAGDTNVKVASVGGLVVGQPISIDTGASLESPTVTAIGTAATSTTLAAAAAIGDTNLKVASVTNLNVGDTLAIDTGANVETVTVTTVGTAGATGTGVTITPALTKAHAGGGFRGTAVQDLTQPGSGVTFSPALMFAHAAGTATAGSGSGITIAPALTAAHAIGATVVGPLGTGITLTNPLTLAHPSGDAVGISGMTTTESQSEFSLWAMEAAPLIAGTDVVNAAPQNLSIYQNKGVIAVDQDSLGVQATVVSGSATNPDWTLVKPLSNGDTAVALFNAGATSWTNATVSLASLGLDPSRAYVARDLWSNATSSVASSISINTIPAHATVVLRLSPGPQVDATASASDPDAATAKVSTTAPGDLLVAYVAAGAPSNRRQTSTVSGGGLTWTMAGRENTAPGEVEVWTANAPSVLKKAKVTALAKIPGYTETITVVSYEHASGIGNVVKSSSPGGAPTATLTTTQSDSWVFAVGNDWLKSKGRTVGPDQTLVHQTRDNVGDTYWVQSTDGVTTDAGTAVTINDTTPPKDPYNLVLVEILW